MLLPANDPSMFPFVHGAGTLLLLLIILRLFYRRPALRALMWPYVIGACTLSAGIVLPALLPPLSSLAEHILLAIQVFAWGSVGLILAEHVLVERWARISGVVVPRLARDIVRAVAFTLGILFVLQLVFNIAPTSIVVSSTILSAVIGLALQDLLKNVIAGIALQLERPFEVGHWIQVESGIGKVVEMSWRATRVITVDGNYII